MAASAFELKLNPEHPARTLFGGADVIVVWAEDATDAKAAAKSYAEDGANALWGAVTPTAITAGAADTTDMDLRVQINLEDGPVEFIATGVLGAISASAVAAGGTNYEVGDILTLVGGTKTRAATFKVLTVNSGAVLTVELVDPGDYTVAPANPVATTTGAGSGDDCTLTLAAFASNKYQNLFGHMVTLLNAHAAIAGAAVSFATSSRLFTVAAIADDIGDRAIFVEVRRKGIVIPSLIGTITDEGIAGAALTAVIPAAAAVTLPKIVGAYKLTS